MCEPSTFEKSAPFLYGREWEDECRNLLLASGFHLLDTRDSVRRNSKGDFGGPALEGLAERTTLADFLACRDGHSYWIECKRRKRAAEGNISEELESGIPLKDYEQYLQLERESGIPLLLFLRVDESNATLVLRPAKQRPHPLQRRSEIKGMAAMFHVLSEYVPLEDWLRWKGDLWL